MTEKFCNISEVVCFMQVYESYHTIEQNRNCIRSTVLVYCNYQSLSLAIEDDQKKAIQLQPVTVILSVHQVVSLYSVHVLWMEGIDFQLHERLIVNRDFCLVFIPCLYLQKFVLLFIS